MARRPARRPARGPARGGAAGRALPLAALWALGAGRPAAATPHWKHDHKHHHREPVGRERCKEFSCPPRHRPILKRMPAEFEPWIANCSTDQYNNAGEVMEYASWMRQPMYQEAVGKCCSMKFLCAQTCGMSLQHCHETYWQCAEAACAEMQRKIEKTGDGGTMPAGHDHGDEGGRNSQCMQFARYNDLHVLTPDNKSADLLFRKRWGPAVCPEFLALQRAACDCLPEGEWEKEQKVRFEELATLFAPDALDKKGRFKSKVWKSWKGKRHELLFRLLVANQGNISRNLTSHLDVFATPSTRKDEL